MAIRQGHTVHQMSAPARHHDVIGMMADVGLPTPIVGLQGFVLDDGRFVDRREAWDIALANGQVEPRVDSQELFSEDLW